MFVFRPYHCKSGFGGLELCCSGHALVWPRRLSIGLSLCACLSLCRPIFLILGAITTVLHHWYVNIPSIIVLSYLVLNFVKHVIQTSLKSNSLTRNNCIVLYLYIYIVLLAVHTNQKRFQCERHREKPGIKSFRNHHKWNTCVHCANEYPVTRNHTQLWTWTVAKKSMT